MVFSLFRTPVFLAPDAGGAAGEAPEQAAQPEQAAAAQVDTPAAPEAAPQAAPAAEKRPDPYKGYRHNVPGVSNRPPAGLTHPDAAPPKRDEERAPEKPAGEDGREALRERVAQMQAKLGEYQLRTAAALAGIPKERIDCAMRMADVAGLDPSAPDAAAQYTAAIDKVLEAVPELRGGAGVGTGSVGNFARRSAGAIDPDIAKIEKNILG